MTQPFVPQDHLIKIPRRVKTASGAWETVHDDYLEVKWRLCWFRDRYPHGTIETEELCVDLDRGYARYKARVTDAEGGSATGHGTETKADFADYCERAETRALGRALAAMGIGTQFVSAELDELPHVADAPVIPRDAPDAAHETPGMSHPLPVGEGGTAGAATLPATNGHKLASKAEAARMTDEAIDALFSLALERCEEDKEAFGTRLRRAMQLKEDVKISKRIVRETMTPEAYRTVYAWYETLYTQLQRPTEVPSHADHTPETPASSATPAATGEATPMDPPPASPATASSSAAPDPTDAAERDRVRLRAEVAQWDLRVAPEEVEHVIVHNSYSKARALLWKCRGQPPAATPIESAAD